MFSSYSPRAALLQGRRHARVNHNFAHRESGTNGGTLSRQPRSSDLSACFPFESDTRLMRAEWIRVATIGLPRSPRWRRIACQTRLELPEKPMSAVLQANLAAERKGFYDRIDKANVSPLEMGPDVAVDPGGRTPDHGEGSRAARAGAREPRAARPLEHHPQPVRRTAADSARRGRAGAPAFAVGAALHPARQRRLHRGGRRKGQHERG